MAKATQLDGGFTWANIRRVWNGESASTVFTDYIPAKTNKSLDPAASPAASNKLPYDPGKGVGKLITAEEFNKTSSNPRNIKNIQKELTDKIEKQKGQQLNNYNLGKNQNGDALVQTSPSEGSAGSAGGTFNKSNDTTRLTTGKSGDPAIDISSTPVKSSRESILSENVLNNYSSYNYVFTLSGLSKSSLKAPTADLFEQSSKDLKILSSSGKGADYKIKISNEDTEIIDNKSTMIVEGFNKNSVGRFDMYIDNVEVDTILAFSSNSGSTLPTNFRFEVFEPYSMNGFMEALQATALASGYLNYATASYLLKMKFIGYRGTDDGIDDDIKKSTRYFGIRINKVQLDVTEKGTRYICVGIPFNEFAFADEINKLHQNIQVKGITVGDILTNFMSDLQVQRKQATDASYTTKSKPPDLDQDEYAVQFTDGTREFEKLKTSKMSEHLKENRIFSIIDPQLATSKNAYDPKAANNGAVQTVSTKMDSPMSAVVNFSINSNITDCISAIITESSWARNLLKDLIYDPETGLLDYFSIRVTTTNKKKIDPIKNRPYQKFTYVITPYKIHYTLIPGYQQEKFNFKPGVLKHFILREYNYIYTGKNVDVIEFKINFNNSYLAPMAQAMGRAVDSSSLPNAAKLSDASGTVFDGDKLSSKISSRQLGAATPGQTIDPNLSTNFGNRSAYGTVTAGQPLLDPFYLQSKAMYEAIIRNPADMVQVDLGIIGDPVFLADGGVSNYNPTSTNGLTANGAIDRHNGMSYIKINFMNPDDIGTDGFIQFNEGKIRFSGVYMIKKVVSKFSNGLFTQKLTLRRMSQTDDVINTLDTTKESIKLPTEQLSNDETKDNKLTKR